MPVGVNSYVSKDHVVIKIVWPGKVYGMHLETIKNEFITYMCPWFCVDQKGLRSVSLVFCVTCRVYLVSSLVVHVLCWHYGWLQCSHSCITPVFALHVSPWDMCGVC
jgi:hypothetical protein